VCFSLIATYDVCVCFVEYLASKQFSFIMRGDRLEFSLSILGIRKYCMASLLERDIELLERVQHRATKMVPGLKHLTYEERLRKIDVYTSLPEGKR